MQAAGLQSVLAFFACVFPASRIHLSVRLVRFQIPAWVALALWIGLQCIGAWKQVAGMSSVSAIGHLGGVLGGCRCVAGLAMESAGAGSALAIREHCANGKQRSVVDVDLDGCV